jgi:hypothetical protein
LLSIRKAIFSYSRQDNLLLEFGQNEDIIPSRGDSGFLGQGEVGSIENRERTRRLRKPSLSFECRIRV